MPDASACVVLAAEGYPGKPRTGDEIFGLEKAAAHHSVTIFHSGTSFGPTNTGSTDKSHRAYLTSGGRVLSITTVGRDLNTAVSSAYSAVSEISWPGMQFRRDIGK
jgi:phosphoribosylamine--glycine ligase